MPANRMNKIKKCIFSLIFLTLSLIFAIVLSEGLLRIFSGSLPEGVKLRIHWQAMGRQGLKSIPHPYIGFLYPGNSTGSYERGDIKFIFHTDDYGFRNRKPWPKRTDIVIVGDSLAFGYGVNDEQIWTAIMEKKLSGISVLNLGLVGAAPQQYQRIYEVFGAVLHPKLLIAALFPDNDFWDARKFEEWLKSEARGNYDAFRLFGKDEFCRIRSVKEVIKKTYIYSLLKEAKSCFKAKRSIKGKNISFSDGSRIQLVPSQLQNQIRSLKPGNRGFNLTLKALLNLKKLSSKTDTEFLVLIFPSKEAVYMQKDPTIDILRPLKVELERLSIKYLDLTSSLQMHAKMGEKLFFEVDGHPNQRGYEIIANSVFTHIKEKANIYGLIKSERPLHFKSLNTL